MKILALSTAESVCSLAVSDGNELLYEENWNSRLTHSKRALKIIENALDEKTGLMLEDIDCFIAAKGPGGFTGIRIGVSMIQALAYAVGKPAYGVSSLDGVAFRLSDTRRPVCAMMDARRNEVYTSVYRFGTDGLVDKTPERVASPEKAVCQAGGDAVFIGTGALAYADMIKTHTKKAALSHSFLSSVSAAAMIRAVQTDAFFFEGPRHILAPSYVRKSDAEMQYVKTQR